MKKKLRHWALCALIAAGSTMAAWSLSEIRFFQILNLKAYDSHFVVRGAQPTSNIVLLTADRKAMDTFPELMLFWNKHYADAIRAAGEAGARVIGLDLAFGIPIDEWKPDYDEMLAGAISTSPVPVICGYVTDINSNQAAQRVPINMIAGALGLAAFVNITVDSDDFVRDQELFEGASSNANESPAAHSLALRVVEKYLGAEMEFKNGQATLQGQPIPVSAQRKIAINYAGGPNTFPSVSLADFEAAAKAGNREQLRKWVNGKIVLIGSDATADRFNTPFYTVFGDQWRTAGVEVHANTVRTLLDRLYLKPVPEWGRTLALLLATIATVLVATSLRASRASAWMLIQISGILISTHLLFRWGLILSTSETLLATSICLMASVIYRFATAEKRGDLFHRAVSLFVGKQLATSLEETEAIALTGKRLNVTILFTDIRGFTAFTEQVCEEQGPEAVVKMLNEYMAAMVAIIVKYRGHVNKFIGDGILAVFSDDDEGAVPGDHALRTVRCATEMVTLPGQFQTGSGIHTGLVVVGNVGSADKMEYTVLGDTVNLASRLESLNKEHHTKLLMTGATQCLLGKAIETVHLGEVPVRGKALPIPLYTVASLVVKAA
ncbi:MAG TPA: adenylate/guanylate cyclase domain-containing protein [Bryobacteraceae bacterium]